MLVAKLLKKSKEEHSRGIIPNDLVYINSQCSGSSLCMNIYFNLYEIYSKKLLNYSSPARSVC